MNRKQHAAKQHNERYVAKQAHDAKVKRQAELLAKWLMPTLVLVAVTLALGVALL